MSIEKLNQNKTYLEGESYLWLSVWAIIWVSSAIYGFNILTYTFSIIVGLNIGTRFSQIIRLENKIKELHSRD